jgi:pyruvate formate lyase activating enzyme
VAAAPPPPATGRVFDIKRFSTHDGPGIRSTVFFTGCPLRCAWCHNPEAFVLHPLDDDPHVRAYTVPELLRELERDLTYYDRSGGGVTLSGGEPLAQARFVLDLLRACRQRDLHTALDTCGLADPGALAAAASLTDLILYDIKHLDTAAHRQWTGADNQRILDNLELLEKLPVPVWIRLPVIPGVNDDDEHLEALVELLVATRFRRISVLPYHRIADAKYQRLGLANQMAGVEPPPEALIERIRARLSAAGFEAQVGR